jgi:hypothetical protein
MVRYPVIALSILVVAAAGLLWLLSGPQTMVAGGIPPPAPAAERGQ